MDLDDCEDAATRAKAPPAKKAAPDREWARDAIYVLREFDCLVRGMNCPQHTCPICLVHGDHKTDCMLRRLLRHAEHAERPENGRSREAALRTVGRLTHWWGFQDGELEDAKVEATADFERALDGRAEESRPDHHQEADEAAGAASTGVDELVAAIAGEHMADAAVHVQSTVELAQKAIEAARAEAHLEPTDVQHIRCTLDRASGGMEHAAGAVERFAAFAKGREAWLLGKLQELQERVEQDVPDGPRLYAAEGGEA